MEKLLKDENYLNKVLNKRFTKRADLIAKNNLKEIYEIYWSYKVFLIR